MENLENQNQNLEAETQDTEQKTYTAEEVANLIQAEADKRVTQALKTQQKKFEKQLTLSQLDGDERAKAEKDNRIAELEEQLQQFQVEKNKSELKSVLATRGLSAEFADIIVINDDIETSQANIDKLDKLFKKAVQDEVERRLAGPAPKGNGNQQPITKDSIKNMSLAELQRLKATQPELYANLYN